MEEREINRKQFFIYCPLCDQEIKGYSANQVNYNLDTHTRQKHELIKKEIDKDFPLKKKYKKDKRKFAKGEK